MKKILSILILIISFHSAYSQKGYDIKINFKNDIPDSVIYLARYFGKSLPTIYLVDSATVVNKKYAHFSSKEKLVGGLYLVLFNKKSKFIDVVMDNGLKMEIDLDNNNIYKGSKIKGNRDNEENLKFQAEAEKYAAESKRLSGQYQYAKTQADSNKVWEEIKANNELFLAKRKQIATSNPNSLLSKLFAALEKPQAPEGTHYKEDGTVDSFYSYYYVKNNFWNSFDFKDDRLIHAPIYDSKLKDYFDNYTLAIPDSFNIEADNLLAKMDPKSELFKYTLHFLGNYTRTHKIMGMDESFIYLVENYFMKGYAHWLDEKQLKEIYIEPAQKIAPTVLGNQAPELEMVDAYTLQPRKLSTYDAEYTLLIIWSIQCGHCDTEIPLMDSVYTHSLIKKGVRIFSVPTGNDAELKDIHEKIEKLKLKHWTHSIDIDGKSKFQSKYNAYSTPVMYILDKDKKIRGKNFNHATIEQLLDFIIKQDKEKQSKK